MGIIMRSTEKDKAEKEDKVYETVGPASQRIIRFQRDGLSFLETSYSSADPASNLAGHTWTGSAWLGSRGFINIGMRVLITEEHIVTTRGVQAELTNQEMTNPTSGQQRHNEMTRRHKGSKRF
ncbi:hypothetical protein RRG08_008235 [Elysia crispata]|uniref:Uncharacterized protein n=1 Tax=Elysia crispata TaxID=231223 RepID=A0AAE0YBN0_9GAST|nr:hypothetical protein RRG08_008235 [Elysia crispata]